MCVNWDERNTTSLINSAEISDCAATYFEARYLQLLSNCVNLYVEELTFTNVTLKVTITKPMQMQR